jgi:D-alanyl-D-alanine carboxypeptidase/D-alanyl-D-alanine-endopeptidase (penicillin-binding protein 4)
VKALLALIAIGFLPICAICYSFDHEMVGIYAVESNTGKVLLEKNSAVSFVPASCMKIVTTAAALQILGADSRFETHLEYDGVIDANHTLHGNIYIRGGGDPCLGSDRIEGTLSWKKQIAAWTDVIEKLGIQSIEGTVIGDANKWETALAVPSWSWEDLGNYYGAGACALSFHENCYSLVLKPGKQVGDNAAIVRTDPPVPRLIFQNEVTTGPVGSGDQACIYGSENSWVQSVRGTIPAAVKEFTIRGAIPNPALYVAGLLQTELETRGIQVHPGKPKSQTKRVSIHTTYSPTVGEIVHWTNQQSINLYAEHLLKKMGEVIYREGSTAAGIKAVTHFWKSQKIDLEGFYMADGSGLSRKNLITAATLVQILVKMKASPHFPIFLASLPQTQGEIRAKSGSMSQIKGYAGYTENVVFAILANQFTNRGLINEQMDRFFVHLDAFNKNRSDHSILE